MTTYDLNKKLQDILNQQDADGLNLWFSQINRSDMVEKILNEVLMADLAPEVSPDQHHAHLLYLSENIQENWKKTFTDALLPYYAKIGAIDVINNMPAKPCTPVLLRRITNGFKASSYWQTLSQFMWLLTRVKHIYLRHALACEFSAGFANYGSNDFDFLKEMLLQVTAAWQDHPYYQAIETNGDDQHMVFRFFGLFCQKILPVFLLNQFVQADFNLLFNGESGEDAENKNISQHRSLLTLKFLAEKMLHYCLSKPKAWKNAHIYINHAADAIWPTLARPVNSQTDLSNPDQDDGHLANIYQKIILKIKLFLQVIETKYTEKEEKILLSEANISKNSLLLHTLLKLTMTEHQLDLDETVFEAAACGDKEQVDSLCQQGASYDWAVAGYATGNHTAYVEDIMQKQLASSYSAMFGYGQGQHYAIINTELQTNDNLKIQSFIGYGLLNTLYWHHEAETIGIIAHLDHVMLRRLIGHWGLHFNPTMHQAHLFRTADYLREKNNQETNNDMLKHINEWLPYFSFQDEAEKQLQKAFHDEKLPDMNSQSYHLLKKLVNDLMQFFYCCSTDKHWDKIRVYCLSLVNPQMKSRSRDAEDKDYQAAFSIRCRSAIEIQLFHLSDHDVFYSSDPYYGERAVEILNLAVAIADQAAENQIDDSITEPENFPCSVFPTYLNQARAG